MAALVAGSVMPLSDDTDSTVTAGNTASGWNIWGSYRFQGGVPTPPTGDDDLPGPAGIWGVFDGGL